MLKYAVVETSLPVTEVDSIRLMYGATKSTFGFDLMTASSLVVRLIFAQSAPFIGVEPTVGGSAL